MRRLCALLLCVACPKPDPLTPAPEPIATSQTPTSTPSGLDGWLLFQHDDGWWYAELWGDDAGAVAREATESGAGPTYGTDPSQVADADPEWARRFVAGWGASPLMTAHAVQADSSEVPLTLKLGAVVPAVREDQRLGLRVWAQAVGGPEGASLAVFHPKQGNVTAAGLAIPCPTDTPPLPLDETGWTTATGDVGCVVLPLDDASHLVAFEHPVQTSALQGRCVASAIRRDHGGIQRFRTSCRETPQPVGPRASSPTGWWVSLGQRRWVMAWDTGSQTQLCLAATPATDRPWNPVACVTTSSDAGPKP